MVQAIAPEQLRDRLDAGDEISVVDSRDADSFDSWHVPGAVRYEFDLEEELDADTFQRETGIEPDDEVVTVCAKGISSEYLAERLQGAGYERVATLEDGMEGWSRVYDVVDLELDDGVEVVQFQRRAKGCLSYLVADPTTGVAAVFDPSRHTDQYTEIAAARDYEVEHVFDTHVHADHISGGRTLADQTGATYYLPERASDRNVRYSFEPLARNEVVSVESLDVKALATPGHTGESTSYLVDDVALLTGDTLFVDSVGRTELQYGEADAERGAQLLYQSLHGTLLAEPDGITVLPGHFALVDGGQPTVTPGTPVTTTVRTVRTELALLALDEDAFVDRITGSLPDQPANYEEVIDVNLGRFHPGDDEAAAELETGPNNCAATGD